MRATLLLLALLLVPGLAAAEDPDPRPLCNGEGIVRLGECHDGYTAHVCGGNDSLRGLGCFVL